MATLARQPNAKEVPRDIRTKTKMILKAVMIAFVATPVCWLGVGSSRWEGSSVKAGIWHSPVPETGGIVPEIKVTIGDESAGSCNIELRGSDYSGVMFTRSGFTPA